MVKFYIVHMYTRLCNRWWSSTLFRELRACSLTRGTIMYCIYQQYIHSCPIYRCMVSVLNNCIIISVVCYFLSIFSYFSLLYSLLLIVAFTHVHLRAYSIEPSPSWEANIFSVKKFPSFQGTQRFISAFTSAATCCTHSYSSVILSWFYDTVVSI